MRWMNYSSMCKGKHRHKSQGAAEAHLRALVRAGDTSQQRAYVCFFCKAWHVGRKPKAEA